MACAGADGSSLHSAAAESETLISEGAKRSGFRELGPATSGNSLPARLLPPQGAGADILFARLFLRRSS